MTKNKIKTTRQLKTELLKYILEIHIYIYYLFKIHIHAKITLDSGPIVWGCKNIPTASLQKGKTPKMRVPDLTLNNRMVRLVLEGMWSTPLLPSFPSPLWPEMVASDRVLSMGQIKLNCVYAILNCLK